MEDLLKTVPEIRSILVISGQPDVTRFNGFARLVGLVAARAQAAGYRGAADTETQTDRRRAGLGEQSGIAWACAAAAGRCSSCCRPRAPMSNSRTYSDKLLERVESYPGLTNVETDLNLNSPELSVEIDRDKVADLGLDISVIGRTMETLLGGRTVTRYEVDGEQFDVMRAAQGRGARLARHAVAHFRALGLGRNGAAFEYREGA